MLNILSFRYLWFKWCRDIVCPPESCSLNTYWLQSNKRKTNSMDHFRISIFNSQIMMSKFSFEVQTGFYPTNILTCSGQKLESFWEGCKQQSIKCKLHSALSNILMSLHSINFLTLTSAMNRPSFSAACFILFCS